MIEINKVILDIESKGCKLQKEVIENIQYVNDLLESAKITHTKASHHVGSERVLVTPSIVLVNGVDLSAAARVMRTQFLKIKDAKEKGSFTSRNVWYNVGRTAGINVPLIIQKVPQNELPTALFYGGVAGILLFLIVTTGCIVRRRQLKAKTITEHQEQNQAMVMPISEAALFKSVRDKCEN